MKSKIVTLSIFASILISSSYAVSLKDSVEMAISNNPNIVAEKKNQEAYKKYIDERKGKYLPTLDFESYLKDGTKRRPTSNDKDRGYNATVVLKQLIYDGGLTSSEIDETKYQDLANKHRSFYSIENTILSIVKTYTNLVQSDEKLALSSSFIKTNEENLVTAKEKEEITGEVLETYQVSSKLNFAIDKYIEEQDDKETGIVNYVRYIGSQPDDSMCRPNINKAKIPSTLKEAIEIAVSKNYRILEQIEKIKLQREKISQNNAAFLPKLNLELGTSIDKGIELKDNKVNDRYAKLNLSWNLFNGNRNKIKTEQESVFLQEQKKILDDITNDVVSKVKSYYIKYSKYNERIESLKKYVDANLNIVEVYRNEFEAGTRTFVDILNAETELYQSRKSLISMEHIALNNYYDIMFTLSQLADAVLLEENQVCEDVKPRTFTNVAKKQNKSIELSSLLNDDELLKEALETNSYKSFLDAPGSYFTIIVSTESSLKAASDFIKENNLGDNAYAFELGSQTKKAKVLYGVYSSITEAKNAIENLNSAVLSNKPYIDNISRYQTL